MSAIKPEFMELVRESLGWTQGKLAKEMRVTQGHLSKVERGTEPATEEFLEKLEAEREMGEIKTKLMDLGRKLNDEVFVKDQSKGELDMMRTSFQAGVDRLQLLVEENQKPNPIAHAIMEASE